MIKPLKKKYTSAAVFLLLVLLTQACVPGITSSVLPTARSIDETAGEPVHAVATMTATVEASTPTVTAEPMPTVTEQASVKIRAVKGNLFIRRGPDMAFNPVDVLYKESSADVIARDALSNWVQIMIPNSTKTGWVSVQTKYSELDGDISGLPQVSITEWPVPAYLRNCTFHRMYILPSQIYLTSSLGYPENEVWLYPGSYTVYDLDAASDPVELLEVTIREGSDVEIREDASGDHHLCP